jgi:hypothetical protein
MISTFNFVCISHKWLQHVNAGHKICKYNENLCAFENVNFECHTCK